MSYKLACRKPKDGVSLPPEAVYERGPGELLPALETLPRETVIDALGEAFPTFDPAEDVPLVALSGGEGGGDGEGGSSMEVFQGPQQFQFAFHGPETSDAMAKVWQVMSGFGCVCYDPQVGTLYTVDHPPNYRSPSPEQKRLEAEYGGRDTASIGRRVQKRATRRAIIGCLLLLAGGVLVGTAVILAIASVLA